MRGRGRGGGQGGAPPSSPSLAAPDPADVFVTSDPAAPLVGSASPTPTRICDGRGAEEGRRPPWWEGRCRLRHRPGSRWDGAGGGEEAAMVGGRRGPDVFAARGVHVFDPDPDPGMGRRRRRRGGRRGGRGRCRLRRRPRSRRATRGPRLSDPTRSRHLQVVEVHQGKARQSRASVSSNKGFKASPCKIKNCLGCSSAPPIFSVKTLKKIGTEICQIHPEELEDLEVVKKKKLEPVGKKSRKEPGDKADNEQDDQDMSEQDD